MPSFTLGRIMNHMFVDRDMNRIWFRYWHGEFLVHVDGIRLLHDIRHL